MAKLNTSYSTTWTFKSLKSCAHLASVPPSRYGTLISINMVDSSTTSDQVQDPRTGHSIEKVPTIDGRWMGFYENLAKAFKGVQEIFVKPEEARDVIRLIELAFESTRTGRAVPWS
jgi:hypothetical protein